jgi:hypothetical protein
MTYIFATLAACTLALAVLFGAGGDALAAGGYGLLTVGCGALALGFREPRDIDADDDRP